MNDADFLPKSDKQDLKTMDPWKIIKEAATSMGILINNPKPNCKRCHGRGYLGRHADSGEPVPCNCIFPKDEREMGEVQMKPQNREQRRAQKKQK